MTTMAEEHTDILTRQAALESRVILLYPTIGWWRGSYQLPRGTTEVTSDGETVGFDSVTAPRAKLMTKDYPVDCSGVPWIRRFQKIDSRLSALKERYSVPFPITGVRIVPKSRAGELMEELYGLTIGRLSQKIQAANDERRHGYAEYLKNTLDAAMIREGALASPTTPVYDSERSQQSIAYELHDAAREFCQSWEQIRDQIASRNDVFHKVEKKIPRSIASLREKFYLSVVPVELAAGNVGEVTFEDLHEHQDVVRETVRRHVEAAVEEMVRGPRQQLVDAMTQLQELIARDGRVTSKSFRPVREAIAKIRTFDFVADDQLLQTIKQLEERLDSTNPQSLDKVTAVNSGFATAINAFMDEVADADAQSRTVSEFGRELRGIDLG